MVLSNANVDTMAISIKLITAHPQWHFGSRIQMLFLNVVSCESSQGSVLLSGFTWSNLPGSLGLSGTLSIHNTKIKVILFKYMPNCVTSLCKTLPWLSLLLRVKPLWPCFSHLLSSCSLTTNSTPTTLVSLLLLKQDWPISTDLCTHCSLFQECSYPKYLLV